ncbi:hypothetical protein FRX31_033887 [Thalictrum thalictroides]|uniref:Uncharacterized protein n=1 Tax=Thalictrum thalictroides TaxID=46969 RepID=A0A7J6UV92_THATH|nr:hypothetical protein FRX31_033887 [Thalictrum thalictroides]
MPSGRTSRLHSRRSRRISFERFAKLIKSFEEVGLSSYVSTRRRSTRSRRTNFSSLLPIDEQRKHSFLHEVEVYEHVQNLTETMIQSACRKTLMVAFSSENMVASTSYTGSREVALSSYVNTRRCSTRSRRTNFSSLLIIDEQIRYSLLHEVEVFEHVQNLTETMIESASRKTLMVAFSSENMVASTSYIGSIANEPQRRLLLNQPLAPSMKKVSETLTRNARRKKYRAMLPSEQKHAIMELDSGRR